MKNGVHASVVGSGLFVRMKRSTCTLFNVQIRFFLIPKRVNDGGNNYAMPIVRKRLEIVQGLIFSINMFFTHV